MTTNQKAKRGGTRPTAGRKPLKTADGAKAVHKALRCSPWEFERLKEHLAQLRKTSG
jgi:hypothetical protein